MQNRPDAVSAINKCETEEARRLSIYDLSHKLAHCDIYDIGGTYLEGEPELWFYFSTSACPGGTFLLNIFVCHRNIGDIKIGISDAVQVNIRKKRDPSQYHLSDTLTFYSFRSGRANEHHYIKTFRFDGNAIKTLENNILCIPISIDNNSKYVLNNEIVKQIKLEHDLSELLTKQEKTDFILESVNKRQFPAHQIILAAHSPVLRDLMKCSSSKTAFIDISDNDMELLLQFIYTGTIKDINKQDCLKLLEIADKFQLKDLFLLTQYAIKEQIDVKNAVEVASLAEKYSLDMLQTSVFGFIKNHPEILETEGWKNLTDVKLAKKLFSFMQQQRARD